MAGGVDGAAFRFAGELSDHGLQGDRVAWVAEASELFVRFLDGILCEGAGDCGEVRT